MTISGNPSPLIIKAASAGSQPSSVIDTSTVYAITVSPHKTASIIAQLNSPVSPYTELKIQLESPGKSPSLHSASLSTAPQTIAAKIPAGAHENLMISYEYSAKVEAGTLPLESKTIILTVLEADASH